MAPADDLPTYARTKKYKISHTQGKIGKPQRWFQSLTVGEGTPHNGQKPLLGFSKPSPRALVVLGMLRSNDPKLRLTSLFGPKICLIGLFLIDSCHKRLGDFL